MSRPVTFARPVLDLTHADAPQANLRPGSAVPLRALLSDKMALKAGQDSLAHWITLGQDVLPIFSPLCAALAAQDWQIDFHDGGEQAVIDAAHHTLYLPHFGYALPKLVQHPLFGVLARIELYRGLRLAWQAAEGLTPAEMGLAPLSWLKWARICAADADIYMLLLAYAMREEGAHGQIWRYALAGALYPVAATLSHVLSVRTGRAAALGSMQQAMLSWLQQPELVTASDRAALEAMDKMAEDAPLPDGEMTPDDLSQLGQLNNTLNYLDLLAAELCAPQPFWAITDSVVQAHLAQIVEEQSYVTIGPIVMRDADLARKLFT